MLRSDPGRPAADEYAPYYGKYVGLVPDGAIGDVLEAQLARTIALLSAVPEAKAGARYAPGKWSIKEVVAHVVDTERVMAYRLLRIARGDATPLPGFEQDPYVAASGADARALPDLTAELAAVRLASLALIDGLPADAWTRRGRASGFEVSARGLAYIIAGHELHHRAILEERYLREAVPACGPAPAEAG